MTGDFQFPWRFFLGHQACIYAHSIFVEQIKLVYFFSKYIQVWSSFVHLVGYNTIIKMKFKIDII
jgi:hypothetical protein